MTINDRVLSLDLQNLNQEDLAWLHELRNRAAAMQGRFQLKHAKSVERELEIQAQYLEAA